MNIDYRIVFLLLTLVGYLAVGYLSEDHDIPELEEKKWEKRLDVSNFVYMDKWGEKPDPETIDKLKNSWI